MYQMSSEVPLDTQKLETFNPARETKLENQ